MSPELPDNPGELGGASPEGYVAFRNQGRINELEKRIEILEEIIEELTNET